MKRVIALIALGITLAGCNTMSGMGRDIDVSLFDLALTNVSYPATWYLNTGHVQGREPRSGHPALTPCAQYKTRDGWIFIM